MRNNNEKKTITKSFKISPEQNDIIEAKAKDKNMNFSQYIIDCAIHKENSLTPKILCQIENILNEINTHDENVRKEIDKLWEYLK